MKKPGLVGAAILMLVALAACEKPSEGDCKKAISNIRRLLGTDKMTEDTGQSAAWVRSCRGSAKQSSVSCAMEASTVDQLKRCGLLKAADFDELLDTPPGPGSAKVPALAPDAAPAPPAGDAGAGDAGAVTPPAGDAAAPGVDAVAAPLPAPKAPASP